MKIIKICTIGFFDDLWKEFYDIIQKKVEEFPKDILTHVFEPVSVEFVQGGTHIITSSVEAVLIKFYSEILSIVGKEQKFKEYQILRI